jgi:hypothetical protein
MIIPNQIQLEVSKAVEQLAFVDRSYNLGIWGSETVKNDWKHDLGVMRTFGDLSHVRLELLASDKTVLFDFGIDFRDRRNGARTLDSAKGVELLVFDRRLTAGHRVVVEPYRSVEQYRQHLRMAWNGVERLAKRPGGTIQSEHTQRITGGRQQGTMHISSEARHNLVVTRTGSNGYAFASDLDLGIDGVFLHRNFAAPGCIFRTGQRLTAVVIQTPRGFQARNIRMA